MSQPTPETHRYLGMWRPPWEPFFADIKSRYDAIQTEMGSGGNWSWAYEYACVEVPCATGAHHYRNDICGRPEDRIDKDVLLRRVYLAGQFDVPQYEEKAVKGCGEHQRKATTHECTPGRCMDAGAPEHEDEWNRRFYEMVQRKFVEYESEAGRRFVNRQILGDALEGDAVYTARPISVEERLPEDDHDVLIHYKGSLDGMGFRREWMVARFRGDCWAVPWTAIDSEDVDFWMPLPKLPGSKS